MLGYTDDDDDIPETPGWFPGEYRYWVSIQRDDMLDQFAGDDEASIHVYNVMQADRLAPDVEGFDFAEVAQALKGNIDELMFRRVNTMSDGRLERLLDHGHIDFEDWVAQGYPLPE